MKNDMKETGAKPSEKSLYVNKLELVYIIIGFISLLLLIRMEFLERKDIPESKPSSYVKQERMVNP